MRFPTLLNSFLDRAGHVSKAALALQARSVDSGAPARSHAPAWGAPVPTDDPPAHRPRPPSSPSPPPGLIRARGAIVYVIVGLPRAAAATAMTAGLTSPSGARRRPVALATRPSRLQAPNATKAEAAAAHHRRDREAGTRVPGVLRARSPNPPLLPAHPKALAA